MKKLVCFLLALSMVVSLAAVAMAGEVSYIEAPYNADEIDPRVTYVEPQYYENEDGPTIGVTFNGVIVRDGKHYKDMNNNKELDAFEDWNLSPEERAADLVSKMALADQAGFVLNALMVAPNANKLEEAKDENGNIIVSQIMTIVPEGEKTQNLTMYNPEASYFARSDDQVLTDGRVRCGIYRGGLNKDASLVALYNNVADEIIEWQAAKEGIAFIPYTQGSNPIAMGFPDELGRAAAVIGDSDLENGVINADMIRDFAEVDRQMWRSQGISMMYGPQIDLVTDPRWPRNSDTYGERETVVGAIIAALVEGYQNGTEGTNEGSVVLTAKHFPGDSAAENGFESHTTQGQWRLYPTEGSLQNYLLVPFQAAIDAGVSGIMPCYSRDTTDARSVAQSYTNPTTGASMEVTVEEIGSAYSKTIITDLLRDVMGFKGMVNSDSGITQQQCYGAENLNQVERFAKLISAGTDAIGGELAPEAIIEAVETGLLPKADLDRANINRAANLFAQGLFDNGYLDYKAADEIRATNMVTAKDQAIAMHQKAVVLMKNTDNTLPLAANAGTKLFIASFTKDGMESDPENATVAAMTALFQNQGFEIVESYKDAEVAYLYVEPSKTSGTSAGSSEGVLGLVEDYVVPERDMAGTASAVAAAIGAGNGSTNKRIGTEIEVTTLADVNKIAKIAEAVHENGGKVVATVVIKMPWILTNLEPYCDAIVGQYTTSAASLSYAQEAQVNAIVGAFNPTGKLCVTLPSDESVIALTDGVVLSDGTVAEICASPNDVPGYAKDQYIDPEILAGVNGGSYAYMDANGNYYVSGFGLSYAG